MRASDSSVYTDFVMWLARDLASLGLGHPVCLLNLSSDWPRDLALVGLSQPMWYLWHCHSYSMLNLIFKFIVNESFKLKISSVYTDFVMWLARDLASLGLGHPVCPLNLSSGWPRDLALLGLSQPMSYLWHCHSYSMLNLIFKFIVNESFKLKVSSVYNVAGQRPRFAWSRPPSVPIEFIFWQAKRPHFAWSQPPHVPIESIFWQAKRPRLAT